MGIDDRLSTVLVRAVAEAEAELDSSGLRVRVIDPVRDAERWIATSVAGWSQDAQLAAFIRSLAEVNVQNRAMTHYLVERDGQPIATASLGVYEEVGLFAGASTIPSARGLGAQGAVLAQRLADARARGCTAAMMVSGVGLTSQRNAERTGFRVAYTRTKWMRGR